MDAAVESGVDWEIGIALDTGVKIEAEVDFEDEET